MDNKKIAQYAWEFIGGTSEIFSYHNDDKTVSVDVMTCADENFSITTMSTIGLSNVDIGKEIEGKPLRVELLMLGNAHEETFENILASVAFRIKENQYCDFGLIIENVIESYDGDATVNHVLLMQPVFWEKYSPFELDGNIIAWLLAIPVSEDERNYIEKNGIDKFDELLGRSHVDLIDLRRGNVDSLSNAPSDFHG